MTKKITPKSQPPPKSNQNVKVKDLVLKELEERVEAGKQKYGTYLQPFNKRNALQDLKEEIYDAAFYLKQLQLELNELGDDLRNLEPGMLMCENSLTVNAFLKLLAKYNHLLGGV